MNSSTLTLELASPLADWHESNIDNTPSPVSMLEPADTPMRLLSPVELATLRVQAAMLPDLTPPYSILGEAAVRLRVYASRGVLEHFSGDYIARCLQAQFWVHSHHSRRPWRGFEMLRTLDLHSEQTGVEVHVCGEPLQRWGSFRRLRLHERIAELTDDRPEVLRAGPA